MTWQQDIQQLLQQKIATKLATYQHKSEYQPFHSVLIGHQYQRVYRFIHSLNTTLGMSFFESAAKVIASDNFDVVQTQMSLEPDITEHARQLIDSIMTELGQCTRKPDDEREKKELRQIINSTMLVDGTYAEMLDIPQVDVYLEKSNTRVLIDLKTVKPNKGSFPQYKRQLLQWICLSYLSHPGWEVIASIAMPYNPYHPDKYARFNFDQYLDTNNGAQIKVGEQFWNFLAGGHEIYDELIEQFELAGKTLQRQIHAFLADLAED